ncbi:rRNA maturation RNase YbeY [Planctomycetota bacterium]
MSGEGREVMTIEVANRQARLSVDEGRLVRAVEMILEEAGIAEGQVSVAVVDDATIHRLNRDYLEHDSATDVLSFELERAGERLEAEVVVSADTADETASRFGWSAADELLLYVIHGTLHLVGSNDQTSEERARMQARERVYLGRFGLEPRYEGPGGGEPGPAASPSSGPSDGGEKIP